MFAIGDDIVEEVLRFEDPYRLIYSVLAVDLFVIFGFQFLIYAFFWTL